MKKPVETIFSTGFCCMYLRLNSSMPLSPMLLPKASTGRLPISVKMLKILLQLPFSPRNTSERTTFSLWRS
jgi:hypothetical protein